MPAEVQIESRGPASTASLESAAVPAELLPLLRSPLDGAMLRQEPGALVAEGSGRRFSIAPGGIPLFAEAFCSAEGRVQQQHYDAIAAKYVTNLGYPHTETYMAYLDRALLDAVGERALGTVAEICCGSGEAFKLLRPEIGIGLGVDLSLNMLQTGRRQSPAGNLHFIQGDATRLPLADSAFDTVFMLGGIHHVGDRRSLFSEVHRILKPGGRFYFREPLNDFWLWRALRAVIYRLLPTLDHQTERPLRWAETVPVLQAAGFECDLWHPVGFIGFCLFMNSDVLVVNRLFRFMPGIRSVVRASCRLDEALLRLPFLKPAGLQVVGVAVKPGRAE
ncbi:MAG TPA: class I SAM-dependent methyltransferase [Stellaceae bacterium]|nr:class I SAM-dependent methyltransferase [Stellaceae bacterium]